MNLSALDLLGVAALLVLGASMAWRRSKRLPSGGPFSRHAGHDHAALLGRMLRRAGIDSRVLYRPGCQDELVKALDRCKACAHVRLCEQWLDRGEKSGYEAFCPNAALLGNTFYRPQLPNA